MLYHHPGPVAGHFLDCFGNLRQFDAGIADKDRQDLPFLQTGNQSIGQGGPGRQHDRTVFVIHIPGQHHIGADKLKGQPLK